METVRKALVAVLDRCRDAEGVVADYIPELAGADPDDFGIAVTSVLGRTYDAGHAGRPFTIQSISKPFVYALALSDLGLDEVARHVGFEPSGEPFNAISLEPVTGRPANPMINAGAIVTSALVAGPTPAARFERILALLSAFAGRELTLDERVYRSESTTGDRNRALGHLARAAGVLPCPVEEAVDVYFRQCSLLVTTEDLAMMAATLANFGVHPRTGEVVVDEQVATIALSVMATCGMYDDSGEWMVRVGLPAKSGVGGGIVAVQPGEFGIGVYSPPLDPRGNSARGVAALQDLSATFGLHLLAHHREPRSPIVGSWARDGFHEVALRGEIDFDGAEQIAHHLDEVAAGQLAGESAGEPGAARIRLDLTGVTVVRPAAERLLAAAAAELAADGVELDAVDGGQPRPLRLAGGPPPT